MKQLQKNIKLPLMHAKQPERCRLKQLQRDAHRPQRDVRRLLRDTKQLQRDLKQQQRVIIFLSKGGLLLYARGVRDFFL